MVRMHFWRNLSQVQLNIALSMVNSSLFTLSYLLFSCLLGSSKWDISLMLLIYIPKLVYQVMPPRPPWSQFAPGFLVEGLKISDQSMSICFHPSSLVRHLLVNFLFGQTLESPDFLRCTDCTNHLSDRTTFMTAFSALFTSWVNVINNPPKHSLTLTQKEPFDLKAFLDTCPVWIKK